jgi:hypothetical protein
MWRNLRRRRVVSVHENQRVNKVLTDNIQACLNGTKTRRRRWRIHNGSDRILKPYKRA